MITLEEMVALPDCGKALLVAHRWLADQRTAPGTDAFHVLDALRLTGQADAEIPGCVSMIAAGDDRAHAAMQLLLSLLAFDRARTLALSMGTPLAYAEEHAREFLQQVRRLRERGGAA